MTAQALLSRLDGVKRTGRDSWSAKCIAHEDTKPSLVVRELADGRVLLHCFAGCSPQAVLDAAGLWFEDLFPERFPARKYKRERRPFHAIDILRALEFEALLVAAAASRNAKAGETLFATWMDLVKLTEDAFNEEDPIVGAREFFSQCWDKFNAVHEPLQVLTDADDRARLLVAAGRIIEATLYA